MCLTLCPCLLALLACRLSQHTCLWLLVVWPCMSSGATSHLTTGGPKVALTAISCSVGQDQNNAKRPLCGSTISLTASAMFMHGMLACLRRQTCRAPSLSVSNLHTGDKTTANCASTQHVSPTCCLGSSCAMVTGTFWYSEAGIACVQWADRAMPHSLCVCFCLTALHRVPASAWLWCRQVWQVKQVAVILMPPS